MKSSRQAAENWAAGIMRLYRYTRKEKTDTRGWAGREDRLTISEVRVIAGTMGRHRESQSENEVLVMRNGWGKEAPKMG